MAQSPEYPDLRWIPPRSYSSGRPSGQPTKITVHYTAGAERSTSAEDGALYDQRRTDGTSSHYYVDADSVVQCVRTTDRSHTALYHGNREGIHYELCGTVQSRAQWLDSASRATIRNAARQMARDMRRYGIPLVRLTGRQVRGASVKGVCGHVDWTTGWPEDGGSHTDPGPQFPWDVLFDDISGFLTGTQEDDMELTDKVPLPQDDTLNPSKQVDAYVRDILGYDLLRSARTYERAQRVEAKVDALLAKAGDEVQRDAEDRVILVQTRDIASAIQMGDASALAEAIVALAGPELAEAAASGVEGAINRTRLSVTPAPGA